MLKVIEYLAEKGKKHREEDLAKEKIIGPLGLNKKQCEDIGNKVADKIISKIYEEEDDEDE